MVYKKVLFVAITLLLFISDSFSQCAMCKAGVESSGNGSLAEGLNSGILFIMTVPYVIIAIVGGIWYYKSKRNAALNEKIDRMLEKSGIKK